MNILNELIVSKPHKYDPKYWNAGRLQPGFQILPKQDFLTPSLQPSKSDMKNRAALLRWFSKEFSKQANIFIHTIRLITYQFWLVTKHLLNVLYHAFKFVIKNSDPLFRHEYAKKHLEGIYFSGDKTANSGKIQNSPGGGYTVTYDNGTKVWGNYRGLPFTALEKKLAHAWLMFPRVIARDTVGGGYYTDHMSNGSQIHGRG